MPKRKISPDLFQIYCKLPRIKNNWTNGIKKVFSADRRGESPVTATTEQLHDKAIGLDMRPLDEAATILLEAQAAAAAVSVTASESIAAGAKLMADTLRRGGTVCYVAAGSSGLMAAADAQELGGTFAIPAAQLRIVMAGGLPTGVEMPGDTEDATTEAAQALADLTPQDTIIAVSASGTTPFTLTAIEIAQARGAKVIGIANNAGCPLLDAADVAILLPTPPEVLSGSTRLGAGTAQKIALNTLSTCMAIELGHVHDGMMVNVRADNIKLRRRAETMVARIGSVDADTARAALDTTQGEVKLASLMAARGLSLPDARDRLDRAGGRLRAALSENP